MQNHHAFLYNANNTTTPGVEDIESALERLSLANHHINTANLGVPYDYGTNHLSMHDPTLYNGAANEATTLFNDPIWNTLGSPGCDGYHHNRFNMLSGGELTWSTPCYNLPSLAHFKGQLVLMAKCPRGCRLLQRVIDEGVPEESHMIILELKDHLHDLLKHRFGKYVVLKFFQASNISMYHVDTIFFLIIQDVQKLEEVCMDDQGTRAIQMMVENIKTIDKIYAVTYVMRSIIVTLMKNVNGGYVIQQCVKLFPPAYKKVFLNEAARNCVDIARDSCGCCVIKNCLSYAEGEAILELIREIMSNVEVLAEDPYGNYVVQCLVKMKMMPVNAMIISMLCGKYVGLSVNKYGSNVVEGLLQYSEMMNAAIIVLELMDSPEFLNVLQDPFGNYVAQKAMKYTKGPLHKSLCNIILSNYKNLHSHLYGKRVLAFAKQCKVVYDGLQNSF